MTDFKEIIEQNVQFVLSGSHISFELIIDEKLNKCFCDINQITQCLDNILINSVQAMSAGGKIKIRAENAVTVLDERDRESFIKISISDSGSGIPPEHIKKVFDPFLLQKRKGAGLGFQQLFLLLKNHDGLLTVDSDTDRGCLVSLYLPSSAESSSLVDNSSDDYQERGSIILVLDDQEYILEILTDLLESLGYSVTAVSTSKEIFEIFEDEYFKISELKACIIDQTLPGDLKGHEVADKIKQLYPGLKLIAVSGYTESPVMSDPQSYNFDDAVLKPFDLDTLSDKIRKL